MIYNMINKTDISKFSWAETVSDPNGKSSGSKFNAHIVVVTCCICIAKTVMCDGIAGLPLIIVLAGLLTAAMAAFSYSKKKDTNDTTNTVEKEV